LPYRTDRSLSLAMASVPSTSKSTTTQLPTFTADHLYQPFYSSKDAKSNLYNGNLPKPPVLLKEVHILSKHC
uniref:Ovule protein n=1 Tax=Anisakis simplex TaxID=6269 RepID=A0A0M3JHN7_ANISI